MKLSIKNFSNNVLLVSSEFSDFNDLDKLTQQTAMKCINRVIGRLTKLGFTDYKIIGDDSLSIELYDELQGFNHQPTMYNVYPNTVKEFLKSNIIKGNRTSLIDSEKLVSFQVKDSKKLVETEMKLGKMLATEVILKEELPEDKKIDTVIRVIAMLYYNMPINERTLFKHDSEVATFLFSVEKTREEMEELVRADLEYRWEWAKGYLYNTNSESSYHSEETDDEYTKDDAKMAEIMSLLNQTVPEKSNLIFGIDNSVVSKELIKEETEEVVTVDKLSLTEGLSTMDKKEFIKSEAMIDELNSVLKVIDDYTGVIYTEIIKESNLIFDLYVSKKALRSRKLPYKNTEANKILVSIDIKTGDVDAIFKGNAFKLNPFFEKGEEVKTNVLEW